MDVRYLATTEDDPLDADAIRRQGETSQPIARRKQSLTIVFNFVFSSRKAAMSDVISQGPVEWIDGKLVLRIPLTAGGDKLAPLTRGIGESDGEYLNIPIPTWLAEKLRIEAGSLVVVDNKNGKFTIGRSGGVNDEASS